jgi:hypothetical protein
MATTYTQTIEFSVWKEHACAGCGTVFRYLFKRKMSGQGATPEKAAKAAEKAVQRALEHQVDMHPCPGCGLYQPDMIAARRSARHWWTFAVYLPVCVLLFILVLTDVISLTTAALLSAALAVPVVLAHAFIDLLNPNRDLDANRRLGKRLAKQGDLWVTGELEEREAEPVGAGINAGHFACYALLGAAVLCFLLPVGLRLVAGMRGNANFHPEIAGPGDTPYLYFTDRITSVKGLWSGSPRVTVLNAADLGGLAAISATANNDNWGNTISVSSKSPTTSTKTLWARLQLPADGRLAGKDVQVRIDMPVTYPQVVGDKRWEPRTQNFSHTATLRLSSAGAGGVFQGAFWLGFLGGNLLLFLAGGLLPVFTNRFRRQARPTRIFVPDGQGAAADEEDEVEDVEAVEDTDRPRQRIRRDEDEDRPRRRRKRDDY